MQTKTKLFAIALFAMLQAGAVSAQTEETTPATDPAATTEAAEAPATPAGPQIGERYIKEEIGDWAIRCLKTDQAADPCQLYQLLNDADGNLVAEIALNRLPSGQGPAVAGANFIAPLETMLAAQVAIQIDSGQAKRYPFAFCAQIGCISRIGLAAEDVAAYKAGANGVIVIVPFAAPDQQVRLNMSLTGFTAAYNSLPK